MSSLTKGSTEREMVFSFPRRESIKALIKSVHLLCNVSCQLSYFISMLELKKKLVYFGIYTFGMCTLVFQSVLMTIVCEFEFGDNVTRDDERCGGLFCTTDTLSRHAALNRYFFTDLNSAESYFTIICSINHQSLMGMLA